jgi:hypothetical protein
MSYLCAFCGGSILTTFDILLEVGGAWVCCDCWETAYECEISHYVDFYADEDTESDVASTSGSGSIGDADSSTDCPPSDIEDGLDEWDSESDSESEFIPDDGATESDFIPDDGATLASTDEGESIIVEDSHQELEGSEPAKKRCKL